MTSHQFEIFDEEMLQQQDEAIRAYDSYWVSRSVTSLEISKAIASENYHQIKQAKGRLELQRDLLFYNIKESRKMAIGGAPKSLAAVLNSLRHAGVEPFTVIDVNAMHAYELLAGVAITDEACTVRKKRERFSLFAIDENARQALHKVLKTKPGGSYCNSLENKFSLINKITGHEVELLGLNCLQKGAYPFWNDEEDAYWFVRAMVALDVVRSERLNTYVIAMNGAVASVQTVFPNEFIELKRWMGQQADREPKKRSRDLIQADIVEKIIEQRMPQYKHRIAAKVSF